MQHIAIDGKRGVFSVQAAGHTVKQAKEPSLERLCVPLFFEASLVLWMFFCSKKQYLDAQVLKISMKFS